MTMYDEVKGGGAANFDLMKRGEGEVCVTEK